MIVWVASFPRSGNTFFRVLLHHLYGLDNYSIYPTQRAAELGLVEPLSHKEMPGSIEEMKAMPQTFFVKTHELPPDDEPAIYMVRDGRDALVSYTHYFLKFDAHANDHRLGDGLRSRIRRALGKTETPFTMNLRRMITQAPYGGWSGNVLAWTRDRDPVKTSVLTFDQLVNDPLRAMADTLAGLPVEVGRPDGAVPTFEELNARIPQFFRKGKVGGWRDEMPDDIHDLFWQHHAEAMEHMGYTRETA